MYKNYVFELTIPLLLSFSLFLFLPLSSFSPPQAVLQELFHEHIGDDLCLEFEFSNNAQHQRVDAWVHSIAQRLRGTANVHEKSIRFWARRYYCNRRSHLKAMRDHRNARRCQMKAARLTRVGCRYFFHSMTTYISELSFIPQNERIRLWIEGGSDDISTEEFRQLTEPVDPTTIEGPREAKYENSLNMYMYFTCFNSRVTSQNCRVTWLHTFNFSVMKGFFVSAASTWPSTGPRNTDVLATFRRRFKLLPRKWRGFISEHFQSSGFPFYNNPCCVCYCRPAISCSFPVPYVCVCVSRSCLNLET